MSMERGELEIVVAAILTGGSLANATHLDPKAIVGRFRDMLQQVRDQQVLQPEGGFRRTPDL